MHQYLQHHQNTQVCSATSWRRIIFLIAQHFTCMENCRMENRRIGPYSGCLKFVPPAAPLRQSHFHRPPQHGKSQGVLRPPQTMHLLSPSGPSQRELHRPWRGRTSLQELDGSGDDMIIFRLSSRSNPNASRQIYLIRYPCTAFQNESMKMFIQGGLGRHKKLLLGKRKPLGEKRPLSSFRPHLVSGGCRHIK
jgi:hypothetical protein